MGDWKGSEKPILSFVMLPYSIQFNVTHLCLRESFEAASDEMNDETEVANIGQHPDNLEIRYG